MLMRDTFFLPFYPLDSLYCRSVKTIAPLKIGGLIELFQYSRQKEPAFNRNFLIIIVPRV